jgi:hypothetical protein
VSAPSLTAERAGAEFSPCRRYRYALYRDRGALLGPKVMFVGLNPSTADETVDDPTIRRCIRFARDWGYDGLIMANLYAWRAPKPRDLYATEDQLAPSATCGCATSRGEPRSWSPPGVRV